MQPVGDLDNNQNSVSLPQSGGSQDDAASPSFGKVMLCIGVVGLTFVGLLGVIGYVGISAITSMFQEQAAEKARQQSAEVARYSRFEPFKPGDPVPEPPLDLSPPATPSSRLGKADLTQFDGRELAKHAIQQFYRRREYQAAVQCQFQSVIKLRTGFYNLACFYARAGDLPAAMFWLQVSAREEMANAEWAAADEDLVEVRKDPRWPILLNYIRAWQWKWEQSNRSETSLVLPRNAASGQPLPVFIGLHNMNSNAHNFVDNETYQHFADEMGVAFLGVSGTLCRGKESFAWSDEPEKNLARIDAALHEVADTLTPAEGKQVLFGFSQGASVAAELAGRHPGRFAGAMLFSPGADSESQAAPWQGQTENQRQGIVAICGASESPATVARTNQYAELFKSSGARVLLKTYPGMNKPSFPPDYSQRFPEWGKFILDPGAPLPAGGP
ncbi:MAG TPA: alpha/beta hydrolase-fold protein [Planctomycetaceae bacterium]